MDTAHYAMQMERKLVENFKQLFYSKLGYYPEVLTKNYIECRESLPPRISLEELEECFVPFLPKLGGTVVKLTSKLRKREIVELRHMYFHMAKEIGFSLVSIGEHIGNRDHTTVIHGIKSFKSLYETDDTYRKKYNMIFNHIKKLYDTPVMEYAHQTQAESESSLFSGLLQTENQAIRDYQHN